MNAEKHARQPVTSLPRRLGMNRFAILVVTVVALFVSSMAAGWPVGTAVAFPPVSFPIARYAPGGRYTVRARLGQTQTSKQGDALVTIDVIARDAGVHIYSEHDDALYANRSFIGIHSHGAGPRRLRFPRIVDLYDLFGDKQAARQVGEFGVELPANTTAFYFLGTAEEWQRAE